MIVIVVAVFAVQNSALPLIPIRFLFWKFETSLIYIILGSIALGILLVFLFWISRTVRASTQKREQDKGNVST